MEILTREGRSSWFPSGVYFSRVNRVSVFSFSAFLLRRRAAFAPCFNHFLSDTSSGSAITSHSGCDGRLRMKSGFWEGGAGHTPRDNFLAQHDDAGRALRKACSGCRDEGGDDGTRPSGRKEQAWQMRGGLHGRGAAKEDRETWLLKIPQGISAVTRDAAMEDVSDGDRKRNL